jgi:hypothetical protein
MVNISTFMTGTTFETDNYFKYDLREPPRKIIHPNKIKTQKIDNIKDDWTNIPFYPTAERKKEMIQQYGEKKANEIIEYSYTNSVDPTKEVIPPSPPHNMNNMNNMNNINNNIQQQLIKIQKYNEAMREMNSNNRIIPQNVNKFSPAYSRIIAAKPKAAISANIRLGGVYR